jgi:glycosyltransferase involved in cell wall biosynthesis
VTLKSLSIVIPAYNEEQRLPKTLELVGKWMRSRHFLFCELLIVDDGSTDDTAAIVETYAKTNTCVRLIRYPGNRGKGCAVRNGMLAASGEWILYTDADLSTPIGELDHLYEGAKKQNAAIAIGSRALDRSLVSVHQSAFREYSGRFFNLIMRLITGLKFDDTQCGFKLYQAAAANTVFSRQILDGFSFDVEDLYIAELSGIRVVEVPVHWANVEGSKVRLAQGIKSFTDLLSIRLNRWSGKYRLS